ncbi:unnamed protein product [Orchesella dallaii]|uniref:Uncharacterized protein n=1 Tax=Orchesella dallaii TaxID=48710 RepID=A0ABP1QED3_9HEXA
MGEPNAGMENEPDTVTLKDIFTLVQKVKEDTTLLRRDVLKKIEDVEKRVQGVEEKFERLEERQGELEDSKVSTDYLKRTLKIIVPAKVQCDFERVRPTEKAGNRPLRLFFQNPAIKNEVRKNCPKLKVNEKFKKVYVKNDLTRLQQEMASPMTTRAAARSRQETKTAEQVPGPSNVTNTQQDISTPVVEPRIYARRRQATTTEGETSKNKRIRSEVFGSGGLERTEEELMFFD